MDNNIQQSKSHSSQLQSGERFAFGENWSRFLTNLSEEQIGESIASLKIMLNVTDLSGKTFLDVGCGSGLSSLAAKRLGANVISFDFDPTSVACTQQLKDRFFADDPAWIIKEGSALDNAFLKDLGKHDIVYSWGVLHHTGSMWQALENMVTLVEPDGNLFISIYNDQGGASSRWLSIKKMYNRYRWSRPFLVVGYMVFKGGPSLLLHKITGKTPGRGMNYWYDLLDWLGGYPFEVAKPEEIFVFYKDRQFNLAKLKTWAGGHGCNEYVFKHEIVADL